MEGLLIVGHGTREPAGLAEFHELFKLVARQAGDRVVESCFLELAEPTIAEGVRRAVERGVRRLTVLPLLLFSAGHAKRDIPAALAAQLASYPGLEIHQARPLESHPAIIELSVIRYRAAIANLSPTPDSETLLLMVGRGSHDPEANAEMARFARLRWEREPVGWLEIGFLAMAEPSLERALQLVSEMPFSRVVVQPHLLFRGRLLSEVWNAVERIRHSSPQMEWVVTEHLGPQSLLAQAVIDVAWPKDTLPVGLARD